MLLQSWLAAPFLDSSFPLPLDQPFSGAMARHEGLSRHALTVLCASGHLRRPIQGVYLTAQAGDSIRLRAASLKLVAPPDSVVCDRHAGWLAGAQMLLAPNEHLELLPLSVFRPSGAGRLRNGLVDSGERNLVEADVMEIHGVRATTPLRTAWDLGRLSKRDRAIAGLDAMLRLGDFTKEELLAGVERFRRMRWVTQLRALAPLADGRAESPGESVLRLRWLDTPLPAPEPQIEVWCSGALVARLDVGNRELMFAAEYDGAEWHSSPEQRQHDDRRRTRLDEDFGWTIRPVTSRNLFGARQDIREVLMSGAAEARRRRGRQIV